LGVELEIERVQNRDLIDRNDPITDVQPNLCRE
jgi:hypothetical protein